MKRILHVEDSKADRVIAQKCLSEIKPDLEFVNLETVEEAIYYLTHDHEDIDLVLLDLNLPGDSGLELLNYIKGHEQMKYLPVIILSSSDNPADIKVSYEGYANTYFSKPLKIDDYRETARAIVKYWVKSASVQH